MIRSYLFLLLIWAHNLSAQECPYSFSKHKELITYSALTVGFATQIATKPNKVLYSDTEIQNLEMSQLPNIDKKYYQDFSHKHALISDYAVGASIFTAIGIQAFSVFAHSQDAESFYSHFFPVANIWLQTNLATYIGTNIAKNAASRPRPYVYSTNISLEEKKKPDAYKSFFSQHTSFAAANTFLAAHVVTHYYNQKWIHYSAWSLAAVLPAYVGYERVMAGKHFPTDVIAGYIWGTACGLLIPQLHTKKGKADISFTAIHPSALSVHMQW
ncbi:MAG: phosphatase PAP2 family protein [Bacteroidales bacterium]|jgi:membrane-associated phospholipid phosphatase|nr:phosphatase PAP2 family protein [Bacteroidales bacterium]